MKKIALVSVLALTLSGCLTTTHRMDIYDLRYMQPDCANKEAQIRFLKTQMSTPEDRLKAAMNTRGLFSGLMGALNGTYTQQRAIEQREYDAIAKRLIWELRTTCP